jgi:hypothetical protein
MFIYFQNIKSILLILSGYRQLKADAPTSMQYEGYYFNRNNTALETNETKLERSIQVVRELLSNSFKFNEMKEEVLDEYVYDSKCTWDNAWLNKAEDIPLVDTVKLNNFRPAQLEISNGGRALAVMSKILESSIIGTGVMRLMALHIAYMVKYNKKLGDTNAGKMIIKYLKGLHYAWYEDLQEERTFSGHMYHIVNELRIYFLIWPEDNIEECLSIILIAAALGVIENEGLVNIETLNKLKILLSQPLSKLYAKKKEYGFTAGGDIFSLIGEYFAQRDKVEEVKSYSIIIKNNSPVGSESNLTYKQPSRDRMEYAHQLTINAKTVAFAKLCGNIDGMTDGRLMRTFNQDSHSQRVNLYENIYNAQPLYLNSRRVVVTAVAGNYIASYATSHNIEYDKIKETMLEKYQFEDYVYKHHNTPRILIAVLYLGASVAPIAVSVAGVPWFSNHNIDVTSFSTWALLLVTAVIYLIRLLIKPEWLWYDIARGLMPVDALYANKDIDELDIDAFLGLSSLYDPTFAREVVNNRGSCILRGNAKGNTECTIALPVSSYNAMGLPTIAHNNGYILGAPSSFSIDEEDGNLRIYEWTIMKENSYVLHVDDKADTFKDFTGGIIVGSTKVRGYGEETQQNQKPKTTNLTGNNNINNSPSKSEDEYNLNNRSDQSITEEDYKNKTEYELCDIIDIRVRAIPVLNSWH